jgi:hypothetical protein
VRWRTPPLCHTCKRAVPFATALRDRFASLPMRPEPIDLVERPRKVAAKTDRPVIHEHVRG